jgi:hypothetical protein
MKTFSEYLSRRVAFNADVAENITLAVGAANDRGLTGDEWEQITPWGNFPNEKGLQRLTMAEGEAMVSSFNSLLTKLKTGFRGIPIYIGHPDVDPKRWPDDRRIGKIEGLEARADGLYCKPAWNDLGDKNKEQGYWLYPSGVWHFKKCPGGVIAPFELVSVGMTNTPNIAGVKPWAKNDDESRTATTVMAANMKCVMSARHHDPYGYLYGATSAANSSSAKQELKAHEAVSDGFSAGREIVQKQAEFIAQGHDDRTALLKAKIALPESAALHEKYVVDRAAIAAAEEKRKQSEDFIQRVHELMDKEKIPYHDAWMRLKKSAAEQSK